MRQYLPILALFLVGASPPQGQDLAQGSSAEPDDDPLAGAIRSGQRSGAAADDPALLNPDTRCKGAVTTADGADGEGRFRREPAGPMPPPMFRAVDITVDGCDLLLTMSGEFRQLPDLPDRPRFERVQ